MTPPVVRANNVTKVYGSGDAAVTAVDHVSLEVGAGELVLIMGPSGSGKTTLLSMLGGLLKPTSGQVWIDTVEVSALREERLPAVRAQKIGFIFQAFNLLGSLTAEENILFPSKLIKSPLDARLRARQLMQQFGLEKRAKHLPRDLSGGEKQRVAVARALINDPQILLADEPTGNLDSKSGHQVMMTLFDIAKDAGKTVVIVTHNPQLEAVADRILWIEDGRIRDRKDESHLWTEDPVCHMLVDRWTASFFTVHAGSKVFFCSERCRERFRLAPEKYSQGPLAPTGGKADGTD